jgi:hypothetical protein
MPIRIALMLALIGVLGASTASASSTQPTVSITDKHLHTSAGAQTLQINIASTVPVTDVTVFCEVESRQSTNALPYVIGLAELDGAGTFPFEWSFSKGDKTVASCDVSYTDSTTGLGDSAGPFDIAITVGA